MGIASLRGWAWVWMAGALALAPGLARSAEPVAASLPPASAFFQAPNVADALLSPDGRRVALSAHLQGRLGLFVFDLDAPERGPQRVALAGDADIGRFAWVNDERLVFELDDLQARDAASRRLGPGLFSARRDGSELRQLVAQGPTQRQRLLAERAGRSNSLGDPLVRHALQEQAIAGQLSAGHRLLHLPRAGGLARADEVIVSGPAPSRDGGLRLLLLNTASGETRPLPLPGAPAGARQWWFDAGGQVRWLRSVEGAQGEREALYAWQAGADGQAGRWVRRAEAGIGELPYLPAAVHDDGQTLVVQRRGAAGEQVLARFDEAQAQAGAVLIQAPGFDIAGMPLLDAQGRLLGVRLHTDAEHTHWFEPQRRQLQQQVDDKLPERSNHIECVRCSGPQAAVLVHSASDRHPGE